MITIIKVGGGIVEDAASLDRLLNDFSLVNGDKILVHGGGRSATRLASQLGIESKMVNGRRVTDAEMLRVVTMVYAGLVNKNIVANLQARQLNAIGLTGADGNYLLAHRRPPLSIVNSETQEKETVDYGFVGDVDGCDASVLLSLLRQNIVPVLAPLTHDGKGQMLNTNADTIASETAKALAAQYDVTLIYSFEKKGVLKNPDDDDSVIETITHEDFERYKADGTIGGGMIPKIENALAAVDAGVSRVIITLASAIDGQHGTVIR
jgi:acetylglutamate kinase